MARGDPRCALGSGVRAFGPVIGGARGRAGRAEPSRGARWCGGGQEATGATLAALRFSSVYLSTRNLLPRPLLLPTSPLLPSSLFRARHAAHDYPQCPLYYRQSQPPRAVAPSPAVAVAVARLIPRPRNPCAAAVRRQRASRRPRRLLTPPDGLCLPGMLDSRVREYHRAQRTVAGARRARCPPACTPALAYPPALHATHPPPAPADPAESTEFVLLCPVDTRALTA